MLMSVYEFFKFSSLGSIYQYGNKSAHFEQHILLQHNSAGRERNNFQQLPKLIELIAISTA